MSLVYLFTLGGADSVTEMLPPRLLLAPCAVAAIAAAVLVLRRRDRARIALIAISVATALFGLFYVLASVGSVLALASTWFVGGMLVVVLLLTRSTTDWFRHGAR